MDVAPLEISSLTTGYRRGRHEYPVSRDLTATLRRGSLTALVGTNGSGKSTLLRTVAGLLPPLSGHVRWQGADLATLTPRRLARQVSIVLTQRPDTPWLTAREVVEAGRYPYTGRTARLAAADKEAVEHALQLTGADAYAHRPLVALSDGERQRVMIAKALTQETPAILLDEPTAFLDFPGKADVLRLLVHLAHTEGKTVLLSTHDLELTLHVADVLWLLSPLGLHYGTPRNLAEDGSLERSFGRDGLHFDAARMAFSWA